MKRWTYYVHKLDCNDGRCKDVFVHVKDSRLKWPAHEFERLAAKMGFDRLVQDQTLIGGYFVRPGGDCLICYPYGMDPAS